AHDRAAALLGPVRQRAARRRVRARSAAADLRVRGRAAPRGDRPAARHRQPRVERGVGAPAGEPRDSPGRAADPGARPLRKRWLLAHVDLAEEAVGLIVGTGREEQRSGGPVVAALPELERPEAVDRQRLAAVVARLALMGEVPVVLGIGVDLAIAEVPDEEVAREAPERVRRERQAPRSVQLAVLGDAAEEIPGGVVGIDEALALARYLVLGVSVLLRVADEDAVADRLDAEGRVAARQARVDEAARHEIEAAVEDVHLRVVEVSR